MKDQGWSETQCQDKAQEGRASDADRPKIDLQRLTPQKWAPECRTPKDQPPEVELPKAKVKWFKNADQWRPIIGKSTKAG